MVSKDSSRFRDSKELSDLSARADELLLEALDGMVFQQSERLGQKKILKKDRTVIF